MKYKVGDKVRIKSLDWYNNNKSKSHGTVACGGKYFDYDIKEWCGKTMTIFEVYQTCYLMEEDVLKHSWTDEMIECKVEEGMREVTDKYYWEMLGGKSTKEFNLPDGYIFKDENGNVINATKIVLEKKEKEYPKTYEECVKILGQNADVTYGYKKYVLHTLQMLLVCRDAYWKIAGEEMGLGKPWEPDWSDYENIKYIVGGYDGEIGKDQNHHIHKILAFPTAEMRDAFKENFDPDIEICKEFL